MTVLPNFLVIGAMKAGTTSLYQYLDKHPDVYMSRPKETDFFRDDVDWSTQRPRYEAFFAGADGEAAVGEASTSYAKHPEFPGVAGRIAAALPDVRLVYVVRHPVERMRSQYLHRVGTGKETRPVDVALLEDPIYVDTSRYAMQIRRYLDHFPRERLLVITSEALHDDREATMARVYRFVGVAPEDAPSVLEREFYRTEDKRVYPAGIRTLRRVPGVKAMARVAPRSLRSLGRRAAVETIPVERAQLADDVRRRLEDAVRDDVTEVRTYLDGGFDGWGIG